MQAPDQTQQPDQPLTPNLLSSPPQDPVPGQQLPQDPLQAQQLPQDPLQAQQLPQEQQQQLQA
ncbi:unnamed protein product, partial [Rotaria sp. Silwood2]